MAFGLSARCGSQRGGLVVATRRGWFVALICAVALAHLLLTAMLAERLRAMHLAQDGPARIEVLYVREMALQEAELRARAAPQPQPAERAPRAVAARPAEVASAPRPLEEAAEPPSKVEPVPAVVETVIEDAVAFTPVPPTFALDPPSMPEAVPQAATVAEAASTPAPGSVGASSVGTPQPPAVQAAAPFEWPVSTRISYTVTGNIRGEVHGDAQVEWIRIGTYYQVHLDVTLGLQVAPLMTRSMSSEGYITAEGLSPRRFDQLTKVGMGDRRHAVVQFDPEQVTLANGLRLARPAGVQDTASQFIQLTYLFSTRPELLRPGDSIEVPLALPRNLSKWIYDVLNEEPVYTPFGAIQALHLKPRRSAQAGGDLSAEIWFAPQLRYLPVRIRIHQDAETYIDLILDQKPELAAN
jgi:hypothetical protein